MVVNVAANPRHKKFWIYDVELDIYEEKDCSIIVQEWELQKVDQYFENIIVETKKSIIHFYLIVHWAFYNEIRKIFVESAEKHGIKRFEIISNYQFEATLALKYQNTDSEVLWILNCFSDEFVCAVWEKKNDVNKFSLSENIYHKRTTCKPNLMDLQNFKNKIKATSVSSNIVVFLYDTASLEDLFPDVFKDYSTLNFYYSIQSIFDFLQVTEKQKKNEILYEIQPVLGRDIDFKLDETIIDNLNECLVLPFQKEYFLTVVQENPRLKISEKAVLTKTISLDKTCIFVLDFKIDNNGIFDFKLESTEITFNFCPQPKSSLEEKEIFKIPSKLEEYDRELNAIGIDLGTTECCAYVIRRRGPEGVVLDPVTNQRNLQSYVNVNVLNEPCGQLTLNRMELNPQYCAFDIKRLIGKQLNEIEIDPLWPFEVINYCEQIYLLFNKEDNGGEVESAVNIFYYLLKQIKAKIDEYQGIVSEEVVITVPSTFTEKQKDAIFDAAYLNEFYVVYFLSEPVAALIAYSYEINIPNQTTVFLFDCGGGTTDICIAKVLNDEIDILSVTGDSLLGGNDFERPLINYFDIALKNKYGLNVLETNKKYRLMKICKEIKHTLSTETNANLFVEDFIFYENDVIPITRKEFEQISIDLIFRAKKLMIESLLKAKLQKDEINIVFQVGGGCRMPMIKEMLREVFPNAIHQCSQHPEELVAKGAALYSYQLKTNPACPSTLHSQPLSPTESLRFDTEEVELPMVPEFHKLKMSKLSTFGITYATKWWRWRRRFRS